MSAVDTQREADEAQIKQQVARIAEGIRLLAPGRMLWLSGYW